MPQIGKGLLAHFVATLVLLRFMCGKLLSSAPGAPRKDTRP